MLMLAGGLRHSEACRVSASRVCSPAQLVCDTPSHCWKLICFSRGFLKHVDIKLLSKSRGKQLVVKPRKGTWLILLLPGTTAFLFTQPGIQIFVLLLMSKALLRWCAGFLPVPLRTNPLDLSPGFENTHINLEVSEGNLFSPVFECAKIKHWQIPPPPASSCWTNSLLKKTQKPKPKQTQYLVPSPIFFFS